MIPQINWVTAPLNSKRSFKIHLLVFLLAAPAIWLVWHFTGSTYPWHFWIIAAWTKGLQFHFLRAVLSKSKTFHQLQFWISSKIHAGAF